MLAGAVHVHSDYSHDGVDSLERIRELSLSRGIHWIGLTDHAEDFDADLFREYVEHCEALSDDRFQFVPGLEFRFTGHRGVHLLALGVAEWITPRTPADLFTAASALGVFTILAHPILCRHSPPAVVLENVCAIEVWNTRYNTRFLPDTDAIDLLHRVRRERPDLVATIGLDQHDANTDRGARIYCLGDRTQDPLLALRAGSFLNVARRMTFDAHASLAPRTLLALRLRRRALDAALRYHAGVKRFARGLGLTVS